MITNSSINTQEIRKPSLL